MPGKRDGISRKPNYRLKPQREGYVDDRRTYCIKSLAAELSVSERWIRDELIADGCPCFNRGNQSFFNGEEFNNWIKSKSRSNEK